MKGCEGDRGTPNSHLTRPRCDSRRDSAVTAARLPLGICPFGHHRHAGVTPGRTPARGETHVSYSRRGRCPSPRLRSPARASSHAFPGKRVFQAISLSSRTPVYRPLGCGVPSQSQPGHGQRGRPGHPCTPSPLARHRTARVLRNGASVTQCTPVACLRAHLPEGVRCAAYFASVSSPGVAPRRTQSLACTSSSLAHWLTRGCVVRNAGHP